MQDTYNEDNNPQNPKRLSKEFLQREYIELGKSKLQIANEQGLTLGQVNYDISVLGLLKGVRNGFSKEPLSKELLEDMYIRQKLTVVEMAKRLSSPEKGKVSTSRIIKALHKFNIRKFRESIWQPPMDETELCDLYERQQLTVEQVAEKLEVGTRIVRKSLKCYDITVRKGARPKNRAIAEEKRLLTKQIAQKQKQLDSLNNRQRTFRRASPCSEETKAKLREKAINRKPSTTSRPQVKTREILEHLGVAFEEEVPFPGIGRVDFLIGHLKSILEIDSRYHHNLPQIKVKDVQRDEALGNIGLKVFRVWDDEVSEEKLNEVLREMREYLRSDNKG